MRKVAVVTRANFLPLTIVIVFAALAASYYSHRVFNPPDAILALVGAILTHASVNVLNNYFDYRSKIDEKTAKTPFSGGVEILVKGEMKASNALLIGVLCLIGAGLIGVYFLTRLFSALFPLVLYGAFAIVLYTPVLSKVKGVSETIAGSGFGFMGLGAYVTQAGAADATGIAVFVPVTILVALLLFLNEFPDADVDRIAGRRHLVILMGKKKAARGYVAGLIATYASIAASVVVGAASFTVLLALVTVPIAYKAGRRVLVSYDNTPELIPALGLNVIMILTTILLIGIGFAIAPYAQ